MSDQPANADVNSPDVSIARLVGSPSPSEPLWSGANRAVSLALSATILIALTFLTFGQVLHYGFIIYDDQLHVFQNPHLRAFDIHEIGYFWLHPYQGLYIPLSYSAFGLLTLIARQPLRAGDPIDSGFDLNASVFHLANLVLHTMNVLLVFVLLRRLTRKDLPSLIGAALFAVHPLQVESVVWISELRGLLASLLCLVSIHLYIAFIHNNADGKRWESGLLYGCSLVSSIFAMLAKPSGLLLGFVLFTIAFGVLRRPWRRSLQEALPFLPAGFVLLIVTSHLQPSSITHSAPIYLRPFVAADACAFYMGKFVYPVWMTIDYGRRPELVLAHWWGYADWAAPAAAVGLAVYQRRTNPFVGFGLALSVLFLFPVLGLVPFIFQNISTVADRYAYLALLGPATIMSYALARLPARYLAPSLAASAAIIVTLTLTSYRQCLHWRDSGALFSYAVAANPKSDLAQNGLGKVLQTVGDYPGALKHFQVAVQLAPGSAKYEANVGLTYALTGDSADSQTALTRAIALDSNFEEPYADLGLLLLSGSSQDIGAAYLQKAVAMDETDYTAGQALGEYYQEKGDIALSVSTFRNALRWMPSDEPLWRDLGQSYIAERDWNSAKQALTTAHTLNPGDTAVTNGLNYIAQNQ